MLGNAKRTDDKQFYFVGAGLGTLTGAAYLLRDCGFDGRNIHIIEALPVPGGSNDGAGDGERGWVARGERMFCKLTYENFWDIMGSIPSLEHEGNSVTDDMFAFAATQPVYARARFVGGDREILPTDHYGLDKSELMKLGSLIKADESDLGDLTIEDWFGERDSHFFHTVFWYCYEATFAFTPWTSVMEFRRYVIRLLPLIMRLPTAEGVVLTQRDQYDGIIKPLMKVLEDAGVDFVYDTSVYDMDFADSDGITVTALRTVRSDGTRDVIATRPQDDVVATLGCMTDNATFGGTDRTAVVDDSYPQSATLWRNIAAKKPGLGNPDVFFGHPDKSNWMTFNCTFAGNTLMDWLEGWTHNRTGQGLSTTFVDSPWFMELRNPTPPYWDNQDESRSYMWMCAFHCDEPGRYVKKPMWECTGREILEELLQSLPIPEDVREQIRAEVVSAVPVAMPYINAQFMPRSVGDRPDVVPAGSTNLGFTGQYCEIPGDIVFTEEYSVRASRMAVYQLLGMTREVAPIKPLNYDIRVLGAVALNLLK
ncbi:oleate hydratase [Bifidobacterium amazonense]|uniref:Oleate hydratase n=1 Tax=Bifidobacterium amazonense TaxID=2809027 RepID=A0ABS9VS06_9BIFI|nr:oleate hydratase [Bifidobacterium amazonense]MCH9274867.1 oleate hydratase [Bifidobacterium amazonense]